MSSPVLLVILTFLDSSLQRVPTLPLLMRMTPAGHDAQPKNLAVPQWHISIPSNSFVLGDPDDHTLYFVGSHRYFDPPPMELSCLLLSSITWYAASTRRNAIPNSSAQDPKTSNLISGQSLCYYDIRQYKPFGPPCQRTQLLLYSLRHQIGVYAKKQY